MQFQFTRKNLEKLLQLTNQPVISIYLPVYTKGADQQQNPIRFANQIKKAKELLEASEHVSHQLKVQLDSIAELEQDTDFWQHQKQGLVLFVTETATQTIKLPMPVKEYAVVNHHPFIKPLLPMITTNGNFYILTLSTKDIKLYQANRSDIDKIFLGDTPRSMAEHFDLSDLNNHLQMHSSGGNATYHGQGGGDDSYKEDVSQFLNQVENSITRLLEDETAPLVLSGVEYLTTMYAKHNKYNNLIEQTIEGSPEQTTKQDLHKKAWEIVEPIFSAKEQAALDTYHELAGTGKTGTPLEEVVTAAYDGKIDTLFVLKGYEAWGEYDAAKRTVSLHPDRTSSSQDLLDLATAQTLLNKGNVYVLDKDRMIPDHRVAAVYRY